MRVLENRSKGTVLSTSCIMYWRTWPIFFYPIPQLKGLIYSFFFTRIYQKYFIKTHVLYWLLILREEKKWNVVRSIKLSCIISEVLKHILVLIRPEWLNDDAVPGMGVEWMQQTGCFLWSTHATAAVCPCTWGELCNVTLWLCWWTKPQRVSALTTDYSSRFLDISFNIYKLS